MGTSGGEHYHFRCVWHAVDGHFRMASGFAAKCEVMGCKNLGHCYWYRGAKFEKLPIPAQSVNE